MANMTIPPSMTTVPPVKVGSSAPLTTEFVDRRQNSDGNRGIERRQFGNSYRDLSPPARQLAEAIDAYKVVHRRRYITADEMLEVIHALGYRKDSDPSQGG